MIANRKGLSLSGISSQLVALGGLNEISLKIGNKYLISQDKWISIPLMNTPR